MIAYYAPPLGMSGGMRVAKFAKYLPQFGWQPVILTVKPIAYYHYDHELLSDLKNARIYRSESLDPNRLLYLFGHRRPKYTPRRGRLFLSLNHLLFPDAKLPWAPFAYSLGKRIIRTESPHLIFATAPPYTSLLLGLLLKRYSGLPLICDFRDIWPAANIPPPPFQRIWVAKFRQRILKQSTALTAANETVKQSLPKRCLVIENGYDPQDFLGEPPFHKGYRIVYTGNIRRNEFELITFLEAIKKLKKIKFYIAGGLDAGLLHIVKAQKNVEYLGPLPHSQAVLLMKSANLLLCLAESKEAVHSKLFEYLGAKRPILVISKEAGESARLVRRHRAGINVHPVKKEIEEAIHQFIEGEVSCSFSGVERFSRIEQTRRLAQLFDSVAF